MPFFGAADRNAKNRRQEYADWYRYKDQYAQQEKELQAQHEFNKEKFETEIQYNEDNLRFTEKERLESYRQEVARNDYEFDRSQLAYQTSVNQSNTQKSFNYMAESAAIMEQNAKKRDDLLAVMFDESDNLLEYGYATTGLKVDRTNKLVAADFKEAENNTNYISNVGQFEIERNKTRSESQIETQKAIIEGMKAVGTIRSRGTTGRSSAKAVLGVLAESGALRTNIANGLMYAEQSFDLSIEQLKDMLILDQTMVLAARDTASNEYDLKSSKLDTSLAADKIKISATRQSIKDRDKLVRQNISNARRQADINAEAQVLLQPERLPAPTNPKEFYADYDNPETEDYVEMLIRPLIQEFPEYVPQPMLDYEKDFHYSRGRENVASSNFGDVLKIGGMALGAVGGIAGIGAIGALPGASSGVFGITASGAQTFATIGAGMTYASSSFYRPQNR